MSLKSYLLSVFRGAFVYHHRSLEFRAKIYAAMLAAKDEVEAKDYENIKNIAKEIYKDDYRAEVLAHTSKEYVDKIKKHNTATLDGLLLDIDKQLKSHKRFVKKINLEDLKGLISNDRVGNPNTTQTLVYEFFEGQTRE